MRRVLHVGPCDSPGGMAKVMQILADNPPEGWEAESLSTHVVGNPISKWFAYRKAMKQFRKMLSKKQVSLDLVHVHTAADWSWRRKKRFVRLASKFSIPCIIHIHSGKFQEWLSAPDSRRTIKIRSFINQTNSAVVVLNGDWKEKLQPYIGHCNVIYNPVDPKIVPNKELKREEQQLLLLGRNDPVKGHLFAEKLGERLIKSKPNLKITMTGIEQSKNHWVDAKGWVSEQEKLELLQKSSLLIVPSAYEGQPLVILEALACGLPCLASDQIRELPEVVETAKFENIEQWVSKVEEMLSSDIDLKALIAASKKFSVEAIKQKWKVLYDSQFN
jgi:glycosyltransferase involved in cell wall biosynthesis